MPKKKLNPAFISSLSKPKKRMEYFDTIVSGLFLRLYKSGSKTYFYRYRRHGKLKQLKIGTADSISLAGARDKCRKKKVEISEGGDPQVEIQTKRNKPQPKTFNDLVETFKKQYMPYKLKDSTIKTYTNRIDTELIPFFDKWPVKKIDRGDVAELMDEILERGQPYQANRVQSILSCMFTFGVERKFGGLEFNPIKGITKRGEEVQRERYLDVNEIERFWKNIELLKEPARSLLKMLLLLAQRSGETKRMEWKYIKNRVWIIPKTGNKGKRTHKVPLSDMALSIIEELRNDSQYVFESKRFPGKHASSIRDSFETVVENAHIENFKIHDLRHTASTHMTKLGVSRTVLGKVLNHKQKAGDDVVTARYDQNDYMDEKRQALNRWSNKLNQIITGQTEATITKIG